VPPRRGLRIAVVGLTARLKSRHGGQACPETNNMSRKTKPCPDTMHSCDIGAHALEIRGIRGLARINLRKRYQRRCRLFPALTRWAIFCRRYAAGFAMGRKSGYADASWKIGDENREIVDAEIVDTEIGDGKSGKSGAGGTVLSAKTLNVSVSSIRGECQHTFVALARLLPAPLLSATL
jgi:hypothetical protein